MRFFVHVLVPTEKQKWKMMVLRYLGFVDHNIISFLFEVQLLKPEKREEEEVAGEDELWIGFWACVL